MLWVPATVLTSVPEGDWWVARRVMHVVVLYACKLDPVREGAVGVRQSVIPDFTAT